MLSSGCKSQILSLSKRAALKFVMETVNLKYLNDVEDKIIKLKTGLQLFKTSVKIM